MNCECHPVTKFCVCLRVKAGKRGCLTTIYTMAGLETPCEVCAPHLAQMREMLGWQEVSPNCWESETGTTPEQKAMLAEAWRKQEFETTHFD